MTWKSLPPPARRYVGAVILLGTLALGSRLAARPVYVDGVLAAVMLLAGAAATQKVTLVGRPGEGRSRTHQMSTMSLGFPVVLGSLLYFGGEGGILVAFASALGASLYPCRHPFYRAAFTVANLGLAALASGAVMRALATGAEREGRGERVLGFPSRGVPLLGLLAGTLCYYAVNTAMVAVAVALSQGKRPLGVWRDDFLWTWPGFVAGGAVVGMAAALAAGFGSAVASLSLLCLYLLYCSFSIYLQKVHQLEDNQQALRQAHNELETRVRERTAELARSNEVLQVEIAERGRVEEARQQLLRRLVTAQEEERRRVARELHDQMGQELTALMLGLQSLKDAGPSPSPAHARVGALQELTHRLMQDVHRLARKLRPAALDDLGLHQALRHFVKEWSQYSGVSVDFHSHDFAAPRLPPHIETTLYRVVQEALTNVLKHAQAQRVSVLLERRGKQVLAIVEDNGRGFDVQAVMHAPDVQYRLGLLGMQERVGLVDGTLEIESTPGAGTTVFVHIPIGTE